MGETPIAVERPKEKKQPKLTWRGWIKMIGIRNAAKLLDITYETARYWANGGGTPTMKMAQKIYHVGNGMIDPESFLK